MGPGSSDVLQVFYFRQVSTVGLGGFAVRHADMEALREHHPARSGARVIPDTARGTHL